MNNIEKEEIAKLPEKYKPLGAWKVFGYNLLFALPLIGFICAIVFAFNNNNIPRRSLARAYFCGMLIGMIVFAVFFIIALVTGLSLTPTPAA